MSLIFETFREGYRMEDVKKTMTVGELVEFLEQFEDDTKILLSFDDGYTYGGFLEERFTEV